MIKEENKTNLEDSLVWHFFNLYCLAVSDNEFDFKERQMLYKIGVEHGITPSQINEVALTTNIKPVVPSDLKTKINYLYDLVRLAWADGKIEQEERSIIKKCIIRYGFLSENADSIANYLIECVKNNYSVEDIINGINE